MWLLIVKHAPPSFVSTKALVLEVVRQRRVDPEKTSLLLSQKIKAPRTPCNHVGLPHVVVVVVVVAVAVAVNC